MSPAPARPEPVSIEGPAGPLEAVVEDPAGAGSSRPEAFVVVCHPHPQHGGTMGNKVVTTVARTFNDLALPTVRFNFRGVGASAGEFDDGRGETDDALVVLAWAQQRWPGAAPWIAGFSFGGYVALRAAGQATVARPQRLVTIAPALGRYFESPEAIPAPACPWLIVQGDADEVLDPRQIIDWAPRIVPPPRLAVLPGVSHFFHGRLNDLRDTIVQSLAAPLP
jgi:uncharacterized protein